MDTSDNMEEAVENTKEAAGNVKDAAADAVDTAKDKAGDVAETVKDKAHDAVEKAKELGHDALEKAKEVGGNAVDKVKEVTAEATKEGSFLDKLKDKDEGLTGIDINRDGTIGDKPVANRIGQSKTLEHRKTEPLRRRHHCFTGRENRGQP